MVSPYLQAQAKNGADTPYLVHLLLDDALPPDRDALVDGLRTRLGKVEPIEPGSTALHFSLPEYVARYGEERFPLQLAVVALDGIAIDELGAALRQSWTWADAGETAAGCRAQLTLTDFFGGGVDRRVRLAVFHGALSTLLQLLPVRAVQWVPSQQVIEPGAYLERLTQGQGLAGSALNVRRFRTGSSEGAPVHVLDTMGLGAFGLPDLQIRFTGLEPSAVASWLLELGTQLFEEPDRFLEGGAVRAPGEGVTPFRLQSSLAGPERQVLELDAGRFSPRGD